MAEQQPIDLSVCNNYLYQRDMSALDINFLTMAAQGGAAETFDRNIRAAVRHGQGIDKEGLNPALRTGASIGAMILRAEADFPGAQQEFKARKDAIAQIAAARGGGLLRFMTSTLATEADGAGSIIGVYLATNAADDSPDFSIWKTPPATRVASRFFSGRDTGSENSKAEHWSSRADGDAESFLKAYLGREYGISTPDTPTTLAGGYGAVMLRTGAIRRAYSGRGSDKQIALRQVEDFVTAAHRIRSGQGDQGIVSALGRPDWLEHYKIAKALLEDSGVKYRTRHGLVDGAAQAVKSIRGFREKTTVRVADARPRGGAAAPTTPENPKEFTEPGQFTQRVGTRTGGGIDPSRLKGAEKKAQPAAPTQGQGEAASERSAAGAQGRPAAATGQPARPRMAATPGGRRIETPLPAAVTAPQPLALMLITNLENTINTAAKSPGAYNRWAELFTAVRIRRHASNTKPTEGELLIAKNEDTIGLRAFQQLLDNRVPQRIAAGQPVTAEEFAATSELRRWMAAIARGTVHSQGLTAEQARKNVINMRDAQTARIRREFNIPEGVDITPNMRETLIELHTVELSRITDNAEQNKAGFMMLIARVRRAMFGELDDTLPVNVARLEWQRIERTTGRGRKVNPEELPDKARATYEALAKQAGRFGLPAYFR